MVILLHKNYIFFIIHIILDLIMQLKIIKVFEKLK
jgi:hypothetical protein